MVCPTVAQVTEQWKPISEDPRSQPVIDTFVHEMILKILIIRNLNWFFLFIFIFSSKFLFFKNYFASKFCNFIKTEAGGAKKVKGALDCQLFMETVNIFWPNNLQKLVLLKIYFKQKIFKTKDIFMLKT